MRSLHCIVFLAIASRVIGFQSMPQQHVQSTRLLPTRQQGEQLLRQHLSVTPIAASRRRALCLSAATSTTTGLSKPQQQQLTTVKPLIISTALAACASFLLSSFVTAFRQSGATMRMQSNPRFFLTIPILAGICNAITNKLAVWMMFYPIHFRGLFQSSVGWQGIVPRQVRRMGADISDMLLGELLDVQDVLKEIDAKTFARLLVDDNLVGMCREVVLEYVKRDESKTLDFLSLETKQWGIEALLTEERLSRIVTRVVRAVQEDVDACVNVKHQVVEAMAADPKLIVDLFQTCGKDELKFMVVSGGYGGALLGLGQMVSYAIFPQAWTLVLGGALVGWATDTAALKIMFEPIEPIRIFGRKFQGLFLQRQAEVSKDFATFTEKEILPPVSLWKALLTGPNRKMFVQKVTQAIAAEVPESFLDEQSKNEIAKMTQNVMTRFSDEHPTYTASTYDYMHERLGLKERIRSAMASLPSARFERVLHPVFEQDEATLIAVGSILGGLVGLAQALGGC